MLQSPFNSAAKHLGNPASVERGTLAKTAGQLDQLGLQLTGRDTALLIHKHPHHPHGLLAYVASVPRLKLVG